MKKNTLPYIFALFFAAIIFNSCERKYCYECKTEKSTVVYPEQTVTDVNASTKAICDQTRESIAQVEKDGTHYVTYYKDGKLHQIRTVTTCEK